MPRIDAEAGAYSCEHLDGCLSQERRQQIMHYAYCHKNLKFGWDFASCLFSHPEVKFPAFLHKDDLFLYRAYKYMQGFEDPVIAGALALTTEGNKQLAANIQNLLVTKDVTSPSFIADELNIPLSIITAYEKLFFNVLDRKQDHAYIMSIVYPEGRMVEGMENYLSNTSLNTLIMRSGYNHGANTALYLMGKGRHPFKDYDAASGAQYLDSMFMQDGVLYATAGMLHVKNATPILNARLSIQAGKMGRGDQQDAGTVISLEDTFKDELIKVSRNKAKAIANQTVDMDPPKIDIAKS